jgi:hypothetical protein
VGEAGFSLSIGNIWGGKWMGCRKPFFYKVEYVLLEKTRREEEHNESQSFLGSCVH